MRLKEDNYISIPAHARTEFNLKGNDLLVYGVIHGFSQDSENWCTCSLQYICDWIGVSDKSRVSIIINRLVEIGAIEKDIYTINNVTFCKYRAKALPRSGKHYTPVVESTTNNIEYNNPPIIKSPNGDINNCPQRVTRFKKPTAEEVAAFCSEHGYGVDANAFIDFYDSKGWKIGKDTMKDWKAAVRTWERRHKEEITKQQGYGKQRNSKFADPAETMRAMLEGANAGITELRFNQDAQ